MTLSDPNSYHVPVMLEETLRYLNPKPGETMLDATLGGGGHSYALAQGLLPGGTLIGLDRDTDALVAAETRLTPLRQHLSIILVHSEFGKMSEVFAGLAGAIPERIDGFLFDLGVSSHQLDHGPGFSFRRDERLDMRMQRSGEGPTAMDLLAQSDEAEISRILFEYGEERWARKIARRIVEERAKGNVLETTGQLVALVESAIPRSAWPRDIHVATRTFQGIRIALNAELPQLEEGLDAALEHLNPGGRVVVICYHSLEDRIVKQKFARGAGREPSASGYSPAALRPNMLTPPVLSLLTRKPVTATDAEIARNPRARSAKLRAAMRNAEEK
jgi:16S rRNA (cytosine1402-N4)-methyltransferase